MATNEPNNLPEQPSAVSMGWNPRVKSGASRKEAVMKAALLLAVAGIFLLGAGCTSDEITIFQPDLNEETVRHKT